MNEQEIIREYIEQWRAYIHAQDSPRLKPTPSLTERQPIDPEELEELKIILNYERQLSKR